MPITYAKVQNCVVYLGNFAFEYIFIGECIKFDDYLNLYTKNHKYQHSKLVFRKKNHHLNFFMCVENIKWLFSNQKLNLDVGIKAFWLTKSYCI